MLWKVLDKVFITQCKTSSVLNVKRHSPLKKSNYQITKILESCFQNMDCFLWILLISILIYLKYWYCNTPPLEFPCLPRHLCQISPSPTEIPLQHYHHHVLYQFPYFVLPYKTTRHNYWIYQSICRAKPIKFIIKLYTNHNTLLVKP